MVDSDNYICKTVGEFLEANGFIREYHNVGKYVEHDSFVARQYRNYKCEIAIVENGPDSFHYVVEFDTDERPASGVEMSSSGANIYWLIGVLTYYNLIDKNYKTTEWPKQ